MNDDIIEVYFFLREHGERPADAWAHATGQDLSDEREYSPD